MKESDLKELKLELNFAIEMRDADDEELGEMMRRKYNRWFGFFAKTITPDEILVLIENHFREKGLVKDRDWIVFDSKEYPELSADNIYELFYKHSDKISIFHNIPNILEGEDRSYLWKYAFEYDELPDLYAPSKNNNRYYEVDRYGFGKERYLLEVHEGKCPDHFIHRNVVITISDKPDHLSWFKAQNIRSGMVSSLTDRLHVNTL